MTEREIFVAALKKSDPAERAAYLAEACGDNAVLREQVEMLLREHEQLGSFLESPAPGQGGTVDLPAAAEQPGVVLSGRYKLLEQIGEGGMGTVWMAQQTEPVKRLVAVKLIKLGMDSRQVIARFDAERQALAVMDHPHIAKVHDAGATADGRPFFIMELVKGVPITRYCDEHRLTPRQRLELFVPVCHALQHAHQKGIIHRDLKPSNVLVALYDDKPVPKVIDFGVAKATGQQLTEETLHTGFGAVVGTVEYMSPEQASFNQLDVDTRSDIYALGVLLYELLAGSPPFTRKELEKAGFTEMLRVIREQEPSRPSMKLSTAEGLPTLAANRGTEPAKLTKLVRGELDWIVMKALEKDRSRRYETANGFAMDLQRYLADEPVQACPPSAWYRFRKFVRRHKGPVLAASVIVFLLAAAIVGTTTGLVRALTAERATSEALHQVTAEQANTQAALTAETAAKAQTREALDALMDDVVETMFTKQQELGEAEKAFLRKVLDFYEAFTQQEAETAEARFLRAKGYYKIAHLRGLLGEHPAAETGYRQAEALLEQLAGEFPDVADYRHKLARTEGNMAVELAKMRKEPEAETAFLRGIALRTKLVDQFPDDLQYGFELANNYNDFAHLMELQTKYAKAEEAYRQALKMKESLVAKAGDVPKYQRDLAVTLGNLGQLLRLQEKHTEAEKLYRRALGIQQSQLDKAPALPRDRQFLANSYSGLGIVLTELKREPDAETAFRQSLEIRKKLADEFPHVLAYLQDLASNYGNLAYFLTRRGKDADAEEPYRQCLELRKRIVAEAGPNPRYLYELAGSYHDLGHVLRVTNRIKAAEAPWREALALERQLLAQAPKVPDFQHRLAGTIQNLALLHNQRQEFAAALTLLDEARPQLQAALAARPQDRSFRLSYRDQLAALAQTLAGLADHARLATSADELARFGYEPSKDTYDAAGMLGRCVLLADKDSKLDEAKRKELAKSYADRAMTTLKQAVARGYKDVAEMKKDEDLNALRGREDFKKLLAELERKQKESGVTNQGSGKKPMRE